MTATENLFLNSDAQAKIHSNDFSLKREFSKAWWISNERFYKARNTPENFDYHYLNKPRRPPQKGKQQKWEGIVIKQRPISSPMPVAAETSSSNTNAATDQDSVNRLFAIDNILARQSRSFSPPVFDTFHMQKSPASGEDSDSSKEAPSPVFQSLLAVAKNFTDTQEVARKSCKYFQPFHADSDEKSSSASKNAHLQTSDLSKPCKRKGGWKFHNLSDEGGIGRKKRAYGQNKLENVILQLYQDRIAIKSVPGINSMKACDKIIVIEPAHIVDSDLVKYNTSLRLILDKKIGIYQLQILPFTIQQGSLNDRTEVLAAVSKMLGENGAVLCPGIAHAQLSSYNPNTNQQSTTPVSGFGLVSNKPNYENNIPNVEMGNNKGKFVSSSNGNWNGQWSVFSRSSKKANHSANEPNFAVFNTSSNTDKLLEDLNHELSQAYQEAKQEKNLQNDSRCLLWHVPIMGRKKGRANWPEETKWCKNCFRKFQLFQAGILANE